MIKAGIIGGSGLTGRELIKILIKHNDAEIAYITSRRQAGREISGVFPELKGLIRGKFIKPGWPSVFKGIDTAFICLPHTESMGFVKKFTDKGIKVVDLSADYRIKNAALYKKWYKTIHKYPALLKKAVYGLPMLNRDKIKKADLVANPGCYATSVLLGVIPAAAEFSVDSVIADCKTGISGAGASPSPLSQYININENIIPYKYGRKHRHLAEIEEVLKGAAGKTPEVIFTPQIAALDRGILSVVYIKLKKWVDIKKAKKIYAEYYKNDPFIRVRGSVNLHNVRNTNFCDVSIDGVAESRTLIVISAIDNLLKGASGQAVQNMNIMAGFNEKEGLE